MAQGEFSQLRGGDGEVRNVTYFFNGGIENRSQNRLI